jgi:sarcosine oxidase gamma subunit
MRSSSAYPFLTTAPAETTTPFEPVLRSSLAHRHRAAGARFELRDGWQVAVAHPDEGTRLGAAIADVSHVGKLEVFADGEPRDEAIQDCVPVGPGHWVLVCRSGDLSALVERLAGTAEFVVDRTSAWCALLLAGADRDTLLRRVSQVQAVPGRGPIGRVPATILNRPSGYWLLFSQEFAQYVWDLATDAAAPLGGGAVGVDAVAADDPLLGVAPVVGVGA